jgi:hypothetical protein
MRGVAILFASKPIPLVTSHSVALSLIADRNQAGIILPTTTLIKASSYTLQPKSNTLIQDFVFRRWVAGVRGKCPGFRPDKRGL